MPTAHSEARRSQPARRAISRFRMGLAAFQQCYSLFAECHGGSSGAARLFNGLAHGPGSTAGLHTQLGRQNQGQRGHRAGRFERRGERFRNQHNGCGFRHQWIFRARREFGSAGSVPAYTMPHCRYAQFRRRALGGPSLDGHELPDVSHSHQPLRRAVRGSSILAQLYSRARWQFGIPDGVALRPNSALCILAQRSYRDYHGKCRNFTCGNQRISQCVYHR